MKSAFDIAEKYLTRPAETGAIAPADLAVGDTIDSIVDDTVVAVLIDSTVLAAPIWFALDDRWQPDPGDTTPVFYASELPFLRTKSAETLREIFNVKAAFGGGMVRQ